MAKKQAVRKAEVKAGRSITTSKTSLGTRSPAARTAALDAEPQSGSAHRWTFLTNHSHVLVLLDAEESPVLREVAIQVGITERAVQRIIQDLEEGGFIERERVGRRNRYRVLKDQHLRHSIESHCTIGDLLNLILR